MLDRKTFAVARRQVMAEIQSLMSYLEEYLVAHPGQPPADKVVVCDEGQTRLGRRIWRAEVQRSKSEPALFLEIMERLIIALVGARWSLYGHL